MKNKNSLKKSLVILLSAFLLFLSGTEVGNAKKNTSVEKPRKVSDREAAWNALGKLEKDLKGIQKLINKYKTSCNENLLKEIEKKLKGYSGFQTVSAKMTDLEWDLRSNPDHPEYMNYANQKWRNKNYESAMHRLSVLDNFFDDLSLSYLNQYRKDCAKKKMAGLLKDFVNNVPVKAVKDNIEYVESNYCRDKAEIPDDPYFLAKGTWNQSYDDQWAIKRVGFTADRKSAWNIEDGSSNPVVVAVIDTGLDWNHKDIDWKNLWKNKKEIPDNGIDDDNNGYVDDVIGWNFVGSNNKPWDHDGHGTFVTGIIAATANNNIGIAGINRGVKIMTLKALNSFGHTRASSIAEAVFYAANNGAKVINISAGGKHLTKSEQDAVDYAHKKGVVIVVAAGNEALDTADYSPSGLNHVIAVAATDMQDKRAVFSNWGQGVDIAAPGLDVLSLRGRRTDLMYGIPEVEYTAGAAYVGKDKRYFRASGTSFAAPIVAATASLMLAKNPELTNTDVERMLLNSTKDIENPGWDQLTGNGLLDARAALEADPDYFTIAKIAKIAPAKKNGKVVIQVFGTAVSSEFKNAYVELGFGDNPKKWKKAGKIKKEVREDVLTEIQSKEFNKKGKWSVRLVVKTKKHGEKEGWGSLDIQ